MLPSVIARALSFEFFDAVPLIGVNLAEYGATSVEDKMGYRDEEGGFSVRSADIQSTDYPTLFAHVEDFCDHAPVRDWGIRRLLRKGALDIRRQPGLQWKRDFHFCDKAVGFGRIVYHCRWTTA